MLSFETQNSLTQTTVMQINDFCFYNKTLTTNHRKKVVKTFFARCLWLILLNVLIAFAIASLMFIFHFAFARTSWIECRHSLKNSVWHARSEHRTADSNQTSKIHRLCVILLLFRWTDLFVPLLSYALPLTLFCCHLYVRSFCRCCVVVLLLLLLFLFFFSSI